MVSAILTLPATGQSQEQDLYNLRKENGIMPVYKMVDTCAGEFSSETPYFYSTYEQETESVPTDQKRLSYLVRVQFELAKGVEFDYATVHCVQTLRESGSRSHCHQQQPQKRVLNRFQYQ